MARAAGSPRVVVRDDKGRQKHLEPRRPLVQHAVTPAPPALLPPREAPASPAAPAPARPGPAAIEVRDLHKTYANGTKAVRGVTFHVQRGEIYGLLGPNGAGKSTIIGVLGTLVRPTSGEAFVDAIDVTADRIGVRRRIGFAMQEAGVDELATGREFLVLQGRLYGIDKATAGERAKKLLALFDLSAAADKRIGGYSGGMKRRIDLAAALIHEPPFVFLDEPSEGLDPRGRRELWDTLKRLRAEMDVTILLSTHYMQEADALCDRLAILSEGRVVAEGSPGELKASVGGQAIALRYDDDGGDTRGRAASVVKEVAGVERVQPSGAELFVYVADAAAATPRILAALDHAGVQPASLRIQSPSLDDVYLQYTGRTMGETEAAEGKA